MSKQCAARKVFAVTSPGETALFWGEESGKDAHESGFSRAVPAKNEANFMPGLEGKTRKNLLSWVAVAKIVCFDNHVANYSPNSL